MNRSPLRLRPRLLAGATAVLGLSVMMCTAPPVSAQESVGRGWPMAGGAEWVGAGVPFYNIDRAAAKDGAAPETWKHCSSSQSKLRKRSAASRIAVFGRAGGKISDDRSNSELE